MVGHVCRMCVEVLVLDTEHMAFSTVLADVPSLRVECAAVEADLHDSFNAFCFKCRRITMSVPIGDTQAEQICYLRAQVDWFHQLHACGLFVCNIPRHAADVHECIHQGLLPIVAGTTVVSDAEVVKVVPVWP
jgi:hypothetical protein